MLRRACLGPPKAGRGWSWRGAPKAWLPARGRRGWHSVEATRSTNSTVSCRRSASRGTAGPAVDAAVSARADLAESAAVALSRRLRSPRLSPSSLRSASVRSHRTSSPMPFSANSPAWWPSPCSASQRATSSISILKPTPMPVPGRHRRRSPVPSPIRKLDRRPTQSSGPHHSDCRAA
jgi:hypothetical protein